MKLAKCKAELKANEEVVVNLQAAIKNPAPSPDAAAGFQDKIKQLKKLTEDNRVLNAKTEDQKRVIDRLKKQLADAKSCAEKERVSAQGYEQRVIQLTGDLNQLKGLTYCKNEACPNEKTCGRSHGRKEENKKDCKYWLEGYCRREQRCNLRHDVEARTRAWDAEAAAGGNSGNNPKPKTNPNSGKSNHPNCQSNCSSNHTNHNNTNNQNKPKNPKKPTGKQGQTNRGCQQHSCSHSSHTPNTAPPPPTPPTDTLQSSSPSPPLQPQAPNTNQSAPLTTTLPPTSQVPQFMTPIPPIGMLPSVQMPGYNSMMTNNMMGWGGINPGINVAQLTAMQAQSMTRLQRMEEVRVEINKVREQINSARNQHQGQGSSELQTLIAKEKELTTQLNLV